MDMPAIVQLSDRLHGLYGDRFVGLTPAMALVWLEELMVFTPEIMGLALRQWLRTNTFRAPGLQNLLQCAREVADEQEEARRRLAAHSRPAQPASTADLLHYAAVKNGQHWAQLHVALFRAGVCIPSRYAEAAALCEQFAAQYPEDGHAWRVEALWWHNGAHGTPYFGREPGEESGDDPRGSTPSHGNHDTGEPDDGQDAPQEPREDRQGTTDTLEANKGPSLSSAWRDTLEAHKDDDRLPHALRSKVTLALHPDTHTPDSKGLALAQAVLHWTVDAPEKV